MALMTRLVVSAAVLALTTSAYGVTLRGTFEVFVSDSLDDSETTISSGPIDSGEFVFSDLTGGLGIGTVELTVVFSDFSYATLDDSGHPFASGAEPLFLSSTEVGFNGSFIVSNNLLTGTGSASNTVVGCIDIDPGACDAGPAGSSANDFIGASVLSASTPGWVVGAELDFSAGVTVSSVTTLVTFGAASSTRVEFTLFELVVIPVPASVWFFGSGLMGLVALNRSRSRRS